MKEKSLTQILQKYGLEFLGLYYSVYRGLVISRDDPTSTGRLLIQIPGVQGGIRVWAAAKSQIGGQGWGVKFTTPLVGDVVWVAFEQGDPLRATWSYCGWTPREVPQDLSTPNSVGLITPSGNRVLLDDDNGKLTIRVGKADDEENETTIEINQGVTTVNGGNLKGLVNIEPLRKLITAIQQDLIVAQSGTQVSKWMADPEGLAALEDKNFNH